MAVILAHAAEFPWAGDEQSLKVESAMSIESASKAARRRPGLYCAAVLAALLGFATACLSLGRPPIASSAPVSPAPRTDPVPAATSKTDSPAPDAMPEPTSATRRVSGSVLDAARQRPIQGASIWVGAAETVTDADGRFSVDVPVGTTSGLVVKAPGYEMRRLAAEAGTAIVTLKPKAVRAAYLTYYGIAESKIRDRVLELVGRTELNAVVIDVKGDRGLIPYRTQVPA